MDIYILNFDIPNYKFGSYLDRNYSICNKNVQNINFKKIFKKSFCGSNIINILERIPSCLLEETEVQFYLKA